MVNVSWNYNDAPEVTTGINPAEMAFEGDFKTFVREAIQNSNDAVIDQSGQVIFELKEFENEDLDEFKSAIDWGTHTEHLEGAASAGMKKVRNFIDSREFDDKIRVLKIEDRGCEGLSGGEQEKQSNYYALTKSLGLTNKSDDSSGGSYGLGKSVYSKFSKAGTVIYSSNPSESDDTARLLGRTMLVDHETSKGEFLGRGLYGQYDADEGITKSIWGDHADELAHKLGAEHSRSSPGTSISIIGFSDPRRSKPRDAEDIKDKIKESSADFFWPAIVSNEQRLNVYVDNETNPVRPSNQEDLQPFVELLHAYEKQSFSDELEHSGDIVRRTIEAEVPKHREEGETENTEVDLVIRLAENEDQDKVNKLAKFRGSKMVVEYDDKKNWAFGRPFHAILVCGEARNEPDQGDKDLEKFLKAAEPPEHDRWTSTSRMSNSYVRPYKQRLDDMLEEVDKRLREAVMRNSDIGEDGAEKLSELFPFGEAKTENGNGGGVSLNAVEADFKNNQWIIDGRVNYDSSKDWRAKVRLMVADEEGSPLKNSEIPLESVNSDSIDNDNISIEDEACVIEVDSNTDTVDITIRSQPIEGNEAKHEAITLKTTGGSV